MKKNVASQKWRVFAWHRNTGVPATGIAATITGKIDLDDAGAAAITDTNPTEAEDGFYDFDLTQAETNAYKLAILPESNTSGVGVIGCPRVLFTEVYAASDGLDAVTGWTVDITGTVSGNSTHNAAAVVTALGTGSTLTALAPSATALSTATWTSERAALLDKFAPRLVGTLSGAGTGTEICVYSGVTATYTVDEDGNITNVAFS